MTTDKQTTSVESAETSQSHRLNNSKALELRKCIQLFAYMNTAQKERNLLTVASHMSNLVSRQTLQQSVEIYGTALKFNSDMRSAIRKTLKTPISTRDGIVEKWTNRYVMVALSSDGKFMGFDGSREGEKTFPYAVTKALCSMTLDDPKHSNPADMLDCNNIAYLEKIGLKLGTNLYIGGLAPVMIEDKKVYFAVGGCHPSEAYVSELIRGIPTTKDTLAGAVEMMFGEITVSYMQDKNKPIAPYKEPRFLEILRVMH